MNSQLFYKAMSTFYDLLDVVYFRNYESSPRKVVFDAIDEHDMVLDLCTGTGTNAVAIAECKPEAKVVGLDISKDMLIVAAQKMRKAGVTNMKIRRQDATRMNIKTGCFDKVLLSLVLHETEEELAAKIINEAMRVMKPDGELIVTEWEKAEKSLFRKILFLAIDLLEPKPYKSFMKKDLEEYFSEFGLELVELTHCDYSRVLRLKKVQV